MPSHAKYSTVKEAWSFLKLFKRASISDWQRISENLFRWEHFAFISILCIEKVFKKVVFFFLLTQYFTIKKKKLKYNP